MEDKLEKAIGLYNTKHLDKAIKMFFELIQENITDKDSWLYLAKSYQENKQYTEAIYAWSQMVLLENDNPLYHFCAAECYLSLNDKQNALKALNIAEKKCKNNIFLQKIKTLKNQNS